ncbi:glycosyltransferase family 4 protein [Paludibacterium yongneupense]|uniref:glycosyltransferase family 4 protein n=1 Tax=Paludibacterium yongneupense TaxID=400061 RepID=UPI000425A836|nr:glycosyltransferase family 4 protein [Paludibacterium yongneupense]
MTDFAVDKLMVVGSASIHTWRFLSGIAPYAREVWLACNGEPPPEHRPANLAGVCRLDFSLTAFGTASRLRRWAQAVSPSLVHVHQANSVAWHARRALGGSPVPRVLTAWGSDVLLLPQRNAWFARMVRGNLLAADAVTSDSLYMAARIRELSAKPMRIEMLNYGMDALPPAVDCAAKPRRVLSCRLHKPLYRVDAIVRAWGEIEARHPDWSLTVAASGEQSEALKRLALELGLRRIEFTGFVDSATLGGLYRDSRVFVSVPTSDGTSISLLEAMGHGCLPLLSNLPANGEWVIDGLNGRIVEDVSRLAAALEAALSDADDDARLNEIAAINRRLVAQKALHADNMRRFAGLYRDLLTLPARTAAADGATL